jgi:Dolichyl-phosphate-mannose-protein mannosyltransferase
VCGDGHAVVSAVVVEAVADQRRATGAERISRLRAVAGRPLLIAVVATVVLRVITEFIALNAAYGVSFPHVVARDPHVLIDVLNHWDAGYYLAIAQHGYPTAHAAGLPPGTLPRFVAFGPVYPAAIWLVHAVTGIGSAVVGQLISALAMVAALAGLVHLTDLDAARSRAGAAVTLLVAFPTAFFLLTDYPDSLALALAVWSFVAARHRHWVLAGLCAAGAFMTKYYLAIVVVALVAEVWQARPSGGGRNGQSRGEPDRQVRGEEGRWPRRTAAATTAVLVPTLVVAAIWMVVCSHRYGDALAFVHAQSDWHRHVAWPWTLIAHTSGDLVHLRFLDTHTASIMELLDTVTLVGLTVVTVYTWMRIRTSYGILLALGLATFAFQNMLYNDTREVIALFPVFIGGARWVDGHPWRERVVLACFIPTGYFLITRFVTGSFAG